MSSKRVYLIVYVHMRQPDGGVLSSYRADRVRRLHLPGQLGPDRDRPPPRRHVHGRVRDSVALRASRGDVALPRRSLRRVREHVPRAAPAGGRLQRARPEPRCEGGFCLSCLCWVTVPVGGLGERGGGGRSRPKRHLDFFVVVVIFYFSRLIRKGLFTLNDPLVGQAI